MLKYIAAIDQETTSILRLIFDQCGTKKHQQIYPQPGWGEHDLLEIWKRTQEVIHEAVIGIDRTYDWII